MWGHDTLVTPLLVRPSTGASSAVILQEASGFDQTRPKQS
jgi:hypothetical protein